ncbi:outer membrane protein [Hoeflea poritis]|uniref:Outer membrane beta-barrel protein n=1 Tax=Hoeflea poritis TaxID=2993659 RepID=A0ABT4VPX5_9HYPH|nr:outer membrane beta-barrel protein [Hoeflea poritis]MDA4846763.1 outer membrane beta-barrel protein [Hoeflea poritis]
MRHGHVLTFAVALMVSGTANAEDEARGPVTLLPVDYWTGGYVGIHGGFGFGTGDFSDQKVPTGFGSIDPDGFDIGIFGGYDRKFDNFVLGVSASANIGNVDGSGSLQSIDWCSQLICGGAIGNSDIWDLSIDYSINAGARGGVLVNDRTLLYATGGVAVARVNLKNTNAVIIGTYNPDLGAPLDFDRTHVGYYVGGGAEYALSKRFRVRGEFTYSDYGSETYGNPGFIPVGEIDLEMFNTRVGISVSF